VVASTLASVACGIFESDQWAAPALAIVAVNGGDVPSADVSVPDTVLAGVPFQVSVTTYLYPRDRVDRTEVEHFGNLAIIKPYNQSWLGASPDILRPELHTATVQFDEPGPATILIIGWQLSPRRVVEIHRYPVVR
jgi:hypothetical protein